MDPDFGQRAEDPDFGFPKFETHPDDWCRFLGNLLAQGPELASSSPLAFMFSSHLRDEACVELDTCKS